ncbi:MAG: hypothetical protein RSG52_15130 [Terrisporobacter sp.]|uniref:hypothetical protein n=1 Tax=Terrisporobacter sp. TaxID=1965305 RepID=UPI002FC8EDC5
MYCVIQEIKLKKPDMKGNSKDIEPYTGSAGNEVYYSYRKSSECFERDIKKAYKISIHHSYREDGKVKKKQWVICTIGHYYMIEWGSWIGDCCRLEDKLEAIGISEEELCDLVYAKLDPLIERIKNEYQETEEYRVATKNEKIIKKHQASEREFNKKYGKGYDQCYDIFGELKNETKLNQILEDYKYHKEYEEKSRQRQEERYKRSYYENSNGNHNYSGSSSYSKANSSNHNDNEKKLLKKIYKKMAMEFHPDRNLNNQDEAQEIMVLINKLKEQWMI